VIGKPGLYLLEQVDGVVEAAVDKINRLSVEALGPWRERFLVDLGRIADGVEHGDFFFEGG
jgi:hypothetical protein